MTKSRLLVLCTMFVLPLVSGCAHPYVRPKPPAKPLNTSIATESEGKTEFEIRVVPRACIAPCLVTAVLTVQEPGEEFYCPGLRWEPGDGNKSENEGDCPPYADVDHPAKNDRRVFSYQHVYQNGSGGGFEFRATIFKAGKDIKSVGTRVVIQSRLGQPDSDPQQP